MCVSAWPARRPAVAEVRGVQVRQILRQRLPKKSLAESQTRMYCRQKNVAKEIG